MTRVFSLAASTAALVLAGAAAMPAQAAADADFVAKAAQGGMTEVELGKLAQQKANAAAVKQFADRMVQDHTQAGDELKQVAGGKNVPVPASLDAKHRGIVDKMQPLSGAAFDRAYMQQMVADHKETVALFEKESKGGQDADLKAFATKTLPTLKDHLHMAMAAQKPAAGASGAAK